MAELLTLSLTVLLLGLLYGSVYKSRLSSSLRAYTCGLETIHKIIGNHDDNPDAAFLTSVLDELSMQFGATHAWLNYTLNSRIILDEACISFENNHPLARKHIENNLSDIDTYTIDNQFFLSVKVFDQKSWKINIVVTLTFDQKPNTYTKEIIAEAVQVLWVTMQKRHRSKKIRRYEELQKTTTQKSGVGVFDWDIQRDTVSYSDTWKAQLGYDPWEFNDSLQAWSSRIHPDDLDNFLAALQNSLNNKQSDFFCEYRLQNKFGNYIWIRSMATLFYDNSQPIKMTGVNIDLTEVKRKETQIKKGLVVINSLSQKSETILNTVSDGIIEMDMSGYPVYLNQASKDLLGLDDTMLGTKGHDLWHHSHEDGSPYPINKCEVFKAIKEGKYLEGQDYFFKTNGQGIHVYRKVSPLYIDGKLMGSVISFYDITEQLNKERNLQLSAAVYENTAEGIMVTNDNNTIVKVNKAFQRITGYQESEVIGKNPKLLSSGRTPKSTYLEMWNSLNHRGKWKGEIENRRKNGENYTELLSVSKLVNRGEAFYIGVLSDISELKKNERELITLAHYDRLTGLYNKHYFETLIQKCIKQSHGALLYLDLDRFKAVNDSLGHEYGDLLLIECSKRISQITQKKKNIIVGRLGGDEFGVFFHNTLNTQEIEDIATQLINAVSLPFAINNATAYVGLSIGIALYPEHGNSLDELKRSADTALYQAKKDGRGVMRLLSARMLMESAERVALENHLREALVKNELYLHYQPQIDLQSGQVVGYEALARWQHPALGQISPAKFIPIAEETGLITELGNWAISEAARKIRDHCVKLGTNTYIAVNVSAAQLVRSDLVSVVEEAIKKYAIPPKLLELEITESFLVDDPEKAEGVLKGLKKLGINISIDDFGTGYSSLGYLKNLSFDCIKIDQTFTKGITENSSDLALVKSIIAMAKGLGLKLIAEGVETQEQEQILKSLKCDIGQGWLYGKPQKYLLPDDSSDYLNRKVHSQ